jgi:hypothetical protein
MSRNGFPCGRVREEFRPPRGSVRGLAEHASPSFAIATPKTPFACRRVLFFRFGFRRGFRRALLPVPDGRLRLSGFAGLVRKLLQCSFFSFRRSVAPLAKLFVFVKSHAPLFSRLRDARQGGAARSLRAAILSCAHCGGAAAGFLVETICELAAHQTFRVDIGF